MERNFRAVRHGLSSERTKFRISLFVIFSVFAVQMLLSLNAANLSPLADPPQWPQLEAFQETVTREEFSRLLNDVYAPDDAAKNWIVIRESDVLIAQDSQWARTFMLRFATGEKSRPVPRYWRPIFNAETQRRGEAQGRKPLSGVRIAIDPGHLGGKWAKMEERWFKIGNGRPVAEGDMTLIVARRLGAKLRTFGADVSLVRNSSVPLTAKRPDDLRSAAIEELNSTAGVSEPLDEKSIRWHAEKLFYRVSEIRERAHYINRRLKPDLVLCLHFNAEHWGDPLNPRLVEKNHLHLLANGCYAAAELGLDDVRFEMLIKLLNRCFPEELAASEKIAEAFSKAPGLPPYEYTTPNAKQAGDNPFVWTRNLLANRLYRCPVVYIEPYVMNSQLVFDRVQAGDYEGEREVGGALRKSIYQEYANAVAEGLAAYFKNGTRR